MNDVSLRGKELNDCYSVCWNRSIWIYCFPSCFGCFAGVLEYVERRLIPPTPRATSGETVGTILATLLATFPTTLRMPVIGTCSATVLQIKPPAAAPMGPPNVLPITPPTAPVTSL